MNERSGKEEIKRTKRKKKGDPKYRREVVIVEGWETEDGAWSCADKHVACVLSMRIDARIALGEYFLDKLKEGE